MPLDPRRVYLTHDPRLTAILARLESLAEAGRPIVITGEPGSGRGLLARLIHAARSPTDEGFVEIDCAAVSTLGELAPPSLGTIYFDELTDLPSFDPLLAWRARPGVRVIGATRQRPDALAPPFDDAELIDVPPLRARRADIPLLADHVLSIFNLLLSRAAREQLTRHDYPGNVTELRMIVEGAARVALGRNATQIEPTHLPGWLRGRATAGLHGLTHEDLRAARLSALVDVEREFVDALLTQTGGNVSAAARAAGIRRSYLQKLISRHLRRRSER